MQNRITTRVIIYNKGKILLSRNQGYDFWYPGGGGLNKNENLIECCKREVYEETRQKIKVIDLMYFQEFFNKTTQEKSLQFFFLAKPVGKIVKDGKTKDLDLDKRVSVEEIKWFNQKDIKKSKQKIYPEFMRDIFWKDIKKFGKNKKILQNYFNK